MRSIVRHIDRVIIDWDIDMQWHVQNYEYRLPYCTFGFRETIFLGIIEFYPGYGGFVTFESELVPKLVSELAADF